MCKATIVYYFIVHKYFFFMCNVGEYITCMNFLKYFYLIKTFVLILYLLWVCIVLKCFTIVAEHCRYKFKTL